MYTGKVSNPLRFGLEGRDVPQSVLFVIFGASGDLTRLKLMPALFVLFLSGVTQLRIIGCAHSAWDNDEFRRRARTMLAGFKDVGEEVREAFLARLEYIATDFGDENGYGRLHAAVRGEANRIFYLSTPPGTFANIITHLGRVGLSHEQHGFTRIVVEKPFGRDLASAQVLNSTLAAHFQEHQVYRIDHYLGKETVQNIMMLRFGNGIFEPIWNNRYIDHIQITVSEQVGIGLRADYYERAGALRDMVQNHVLQLVSLVTMEPPNDLSPESIRGEKLKIIRSLRPIGIREVQRHTVRAQYQPGIVGGETVPGYLEEQNVAGDSQTETYVALRLGLDTWRWAGTPIFLRTGKRMVRKESEVSVCFSAPPHRLFRNSHPAMNRNVLVINIQPHEGIALNMNVKIPGYANDMRPVRMDFSYGSSFGKSTAEAYERLLFDVVVGDSTLYTRRDEIESCWEFISGIHAAWEATNTPLAYYPAGSDGPAEARALPAAMGRTWRRL